MLCVAGSYPAGVPYANTTCCVHTHGFHLISLAGFEVISKCNELLVYISRNINCFFVNVVHLDCQTKSD